jgi:hypothetical protein
MEAGDMRTAEPATIAYVVLVAASYEPLLANLWLRKAVDANALIETAIAHTLTDAGAIKLRRWQREHGFRDGHHADHACTGRLIGAHMDPVGSALALDPE